jgi:hypothetical protein
VREILGKYQTHLYCPWLWKEECRGVHNDPHLSFNKLSGYFDPGGKSGLSSDFEGFGKGFELDTFEELPALPDFTIPFRGGIPDA